MIDVLVVGAGPVGLFLARECARRGMTYRIVERHPGQSKYSKALAIFPRTFEVFDMAGIAQPFRDAANAVSGIALVSHDAQLGRLQFAPASTPYPYVAMVPQDVTESILAEDLRRLGGEIEYETTLLSAHQSDTGVEAIVEHDGTSSVVEAKFLAGCDGAHSSVRDLLGLPFEGGEYTQQFMLADVLTKTALPADEMQLCPSELGPLAIFPINNERRRIVATVESADGDAPSLELINDVLSTRAPRGIAAESIIWSSYFRIHHRSVARMAVNRIFVAGDAAHIHSPFGGQGMNTGLQDAWNLAWKLDFASRGLATQALLESYTQERHPIARGVIETTHFLTTALGARNPVAQGLRNAIIPIATHIPSFQRAFVDRLSGLQIAYKGSPIVEGRGERYFADGMRNGQMTGRRFALLAAERFRDAASLAERMPDVLEYREVNTDLLRLVRPDGYVAFESGDDAPSVTAQIESVLARQIAATV